MARAIGRGGAEGRKQLRIANSKWGMILTTKDANDTNGWPRRSIAAIAEAALDASSR